MRTSINLPDALLDAARDRARAEGRTVTSLIEQGLRDLLSESSAPPPVVPLPTWKGGRVLVDLDDKDAVWAILDADGPK